MKKRPFRRFSSNFGRIIVIITFCLICYSCEQYEYTSPLPGILEVRLRVVNTRPNLLPFGGENTFLINLRSLEARKPGDIRLPIYANLNAIRRNPDGDFFNCLDTLYWNARDSALILGQVYAPPDVFTTLDLTVTAGLCPLQDFRNCVVFFNGFITQLILVEVPPQLAALQRLPAAGQSPLNIKIEENRLTRVTVTFDLDSSLMRKAETFEYRPKFYVSSVQNF